MRDTCPAYLTRLYLIGLIVFGEQYKLRSVLPNSSSLLLLCYFLLFITNEYDGRPPDPTDLCH